MPKRYKPSGTDLVGKDKHAIDKMLSFNAPAYNEKETISIYNTLINSNVTNSNSRKNNNVEVK
ncbi:hypothetical protein H6802_00355 [Candidatus Nomurabacteria bacterium]|uniref:Uncharacterized protein n=1 Tax=candidate division WWE3 bacterium TaxID=2053526 RepID=A0A955IW87_UNCKA|nr:hypothetical protein [candidate division WWE3 bacterium]MCB9823402.1 hypothetical protein [Candidatus Nomurabacteria bacterium]MCB9827684.1 hypothetical protein [Candidatus Nomurabacteria bacterium]HXK52550.1 hypothetical protein [bacterium]